MNNELSALKDFSMPEFYFRISRQDEKNDWRYFSKIDRIPWNDLM